MKSTSFKGLAKRVGKKLAGVFPDKRSNQEEEKVVINNGPSESIMLAGVDTRQDSSECHIMEEREQQRTAVEDEVARKHTILERVLAERHRIEDFSDSDDESSVEICSPDRKSSTMSQVMKRGDFSIISGRTRASKGMSVVRDDDIGSTYSGTTATMADHESEVDDDMNSAPSGLLEVLGNLMGFDTAASDDLNSIGTEESVSSTSYDSETDNEDNTTISQWSNSTRRSSRPLARPTSSTCGLTIAEDQSARSHQSRQNIVAGRMSLQRAPHADEVSSAGVEVPLSQLTKLENSNSLDLEDETKSRDVETLSITDSIRFPIFYKRMRSGEVSSMGIELPITELAKLHSARQDNKVVDDATVPILGSREPHVGLPKALKIPEKPAMQLGSDEVTSAGIEIPFTAFPRPQTPARMLMAPFDPEEASSAGVEMDLTSLPKESRNAAVSNTSNARPSISRDIVSKDTNMEQKVVPLSKKHMSSAPSIFFRRMRSEVSSMGIELPIAELAKLHSARQDNKVVDDATVPILGSREPYVGLPKALKIPEKPAMQLGSDEVTSAGIEIPFTAFPRPQTPARMPMAPFDPEEASSAGVEMDLTSLPKESRNATVATTSNVRPSISRDIVSKDTKMEQKVVPLSKNHMSSVPSLFEFFSSWIHSGLICVHCKETFGVMDARSECHVGHAGAGVKGKVHAKCQTEYERVRRRYDKVVRQVALFGVLRRKRAMELQAKKTKCRGTLSRENSRVWSHWQSDTKPQAVQGSPRTPGRKDISMTPRGQNTVARPRSGTAPIPAALPVIGRRHARPTLVNPRNAARAKVTSSRQQSKRDATPILGRPSKSRVISSPSSPSLRRGVQPTPPAKGCILLPSNNRERTNNHRIVQDRDDAAVVCPRYSAQHAPPVKSKTNEPYQQSDDGS